MKKSPLNTVSGPPKLNRRTSLQVTRVGSSICVYTHSRERNRVALQFQFLERFYYVSIPLIEHDTTLRVIL